MLAAGADGVASCGDDAALSTSCYRGDSGCGGGDHADGRLVHPHRGGDADMVALRSGGVYSGENRKRKNRKLSHSAEGRRGRVDFLYKLWLLAVV